MFKTIFIPGNGGGSPKDNWFPYLESELQKLGIKVINTNFPDAILARKEFWLPFIKKLDADENTILIGHSSGAVAAMRFAEDNKILGSVLVSPCYTDIGYENERLSHYYDTPWDWHKIKSNQKWIIQFSSLDDPYIPISEARFIHQNLSTDYHEYENEGHFGSDKEKVIFPEIVELLKAKLNL